jgi:hypothetical protein
MGTTERARQGYKPRRLVLDQLEERTLLSVSPTSATDQLINQGALSLPLAKTSGLYSNSVVATILNDEFSNPYTTGVSYGTYSTASAMLPGKSVASDNNGDFVVVWSQNDGTTIAPDDNVYARYYTSAMQRIDLPLSATSFQLQYNGTEIQELTISGSTASTSTSIASTTGSTVIGQFQLTLGGYTTPAISFDETADSSTNAAAIESALRGLGISQLQDLTVSAVDANHYMVDFGDKAAGYVAPTMTGNFTTVTSGFLPGVSSSVTRTPGTVTVQVSNDSSLTAAQNMAITAQNIQNAFNNNAQTVYISPIFFPASIETGTGNGGAGDLGPFGWYQKTSIQLALPSVTVTARSATEFDVTFTGDNGYQQQPMLSVLQPSSTLTNPLVLTGASVTMLKESSDAFRVNDPETAGNQTNQLNAQVAMDNNGDFVVTWQGYTPNSVISGSGYDIYARRFTAAGYAEQVQQFQLPSGSAGSFLQFATGKGTITIPSFTSAADAAEKLQTDLIGLGYDADTTRVTVVNAASYIFDITWGSADTGTLIPLVMCTTSTGSATATRVSTAQVSFEADNNADGTADTYIQSVTPQGNEFLVNTTTANDQTLPSVAMDGSGNFIVAWQSQGQPMSFFNNIEAQRFDSSGNRVGGEFMVNSVDDTTTNFIPYVGMASDGTFAITWSNTSTPNYDYGGGITSTVYAQVYGPAGNVLMPQFAPGGAAFSTVAFDSNDDFVISWEEDASTDNVKGMSTTEDVYAQEYQLYDLTAVPKTTFDPKVIRSTFRLNSANSDPTAADFWSFDQSGAQVALDADGDLTASYTGFGPDVSNDNVVQEEINNIDSTAISYSQETLTFRFPPVNALSDIPSNWFRLSFGPGGTPTADIQFLPTNTTTTASNIASALNKLLGLSGSNLITVTLTPGTNPTADGKNPTVFQFTVDFSATGLSPTSTTYPALVPLDPGSATHPSIWGTSWIYASMGSQLTLTSGSSANLGQAMQIQQSEVGLLAGDSNAAMFSQFDADPRLSAKVLTSDDVANADRDGQDSTYYLDLDPLAVTGNFQITVSVPDPVTGVLVAQTATVTPVFYPNNGGVDAADTVANIYNALSALPNVGSNWSEVHWGGATNVLQKGPIDVELVGSLPLGTPWDPTSAGIHRTYDIYRITFMGELHGVNVTMGTGASTLTRAPATTATQQLITFTGGTGWFNVSAGSEIPLTTSPDYYIDGGAPGAAQAFAQTVGNALIQLGKDQTPPDISMENATVTLVNGNFPYQFLVTFPSAEPLIAFTGPTGPNAATETPKLTPLPNVVLLGEYSPTPVAVQELAGVAGTEQTNASIGMTSGGSFVEVWTEYGQTAAEQMDSTSGYTTNFYFRTFQESTDTAGPLVSSVINPSTGNQLQSDQTVTDQMSSIVVNFDSDMMTTGTNSVTNPANWSLLLNGVVQTDGIAAIDFGMNEAATRLGAAATNNWQAVIYFNSQNGTSYLQDGSYQLVATTALRDANGNALGRTGFQPNGVQFSTSFNVVLPTNGETQVSNGSVAKTTVVSLANTTLAQTVSATAGSITVTDASQFVGYSTGFVIQVDQEQMQVTAVNGNVLTVTRHYGSTTAAQHTAGAIVGSTTLTVLGVNGFAIGPSPFVIQVDSEEMLVTAAGGANDTTWTVTRGYNGTAMAAHAATAAVVSVPTTTTLTTAINNTTLADDTTTLADDTTTLAADTTWLAAAVTSAVATTITVGSTSGFPLTTPTGTSFTIWINNEEMLVTGYDPNNKNVWYVTRGYNDTYATTHFSGVSVYHGYPVVWANESAITVADYSEFPLGSEFTIWVGGEEMLVTGHDPNDLSVWYVTRGYDGTAPTTLLSAGTTVSHGSSSITASQTSIVVADPSEFPLTTGFTIWVDQGNANVEEMLVTGQDPNDPSLWYVQRGYNSTTPAIHAAGATVSHGSATVLSSDKTIVVSDPTQFQSQLAQLSSSGTYFVIQVDDERMAVTGYDPSDPSVWYVTRPTPTVHAAGAAVEQAEITVAANSALPTSGNFVVQVGSEQMLVTNVLGGTTTDTWYVLRGYNDTAAVAHAASAAVISVPTTTLANTTTNTITVANISQFQSLLSQLGSFGTEFVIQVDDEQMLVTAASGTTWTVTRGYNNTTAATHTAGAVVSLTDATAGVQATSEPNSQAVASNANGDYVTVWSSAPGQDLTFVLSSPISAGYFALIFNGQTSTDIYFDPNNLTQTAANIQAALAAIESGTTVACDAVNSDAVLGRFVFNVAFATASPVLNRPLITEQGPASVTATPLVATMLADANPNAGIYATLYGANWSATTTGSDEHQSAARTGPTILVTASSGTRTALAGTSINGAALAYGSALNYINASSPSVACDGVGNFLVTWSEEDYVNAGDTPDWNVWAQWYDADGTPEGAAFQVNTTTAKAQRYSAVAMDAAGDFVITWQSQGQDGSGYGVYAQRYQHAVTSQTIDAKSGSPLTLAPIAPIGGTDEIDLLTVPSGVTSANPVTFTLTWNGRTTGTITFNGQADKAFAQTIQDALEAVGIEVTVSVVDSNDFAIEFVGGRGSQNQTAITSNSSTAGFAVKTVQEGGSGEFQVNTTTANDQVNPSIAMNASGAFVISWTSFGQGGVASNISNVYAKQFISNDALLTGAISSAAASAAQPEIQVNSTTAATIGGSRQWSSVAIDEAGEFIVTWTSYGEDGTGNGPGAGVNGENGVYARRFTASGTPLAGEFLVNTFTAGNQQYSKVAMDEAGDFTITWESFQDPKDVQPNTSTTPTSYGIYAQRYVRTSLISNAQYGTDANGTYESEFQVNTTQDGDQRYPDVATDDNGDFVVIWSGNGQDAGTGVADSQGVFLQRFDLPNDATGPRVIDTYYNTTGSTSDNLPLTESEILTSQVQQVTVTFSEAVDDISDSAADQQNPLWATLWVHSVLNPANWTLTQNGGAVVDAVSSVQVVSGMPNTYVITFQNSLGTQGTLQAYTLTASNVIQDVFGNDLNTLDGNLSGPGSSFTRSFSVDLLPAPAVTSVSPSRGPVAGGTLVTITGTNLSNATAVKFGTVSILAVNFISSTATQIVVISPPGVAGSIVNVMVVTASGISDTNVNDTFTYVAVPTVASVAPQAGPATGGTEVTITGTGLLYATAVYFGTVQGTIVATTTPSDTTLTVLSPPGAAGAVDVTVVTAGGTSVTSTADQFTYVAAPTVTGINPTAGPVGGNTTVTITGTNLIGATNVYFGTIPATISSISANQIVVITQPGVVGTVDVTVVTTGGTSAKSAADQFTYAPVPVVTGVSPASGPASGGTAVTIIGTGLANATNVYFIDAGGNKTSATIVAGSDTATQLVVTSPASAAAGIVGIEVVTAGGSVTYSPAFTYLPVVTGISPLAGLVKGGDTVTITGAGFTTATQVQFGTAPPILAKDFLSITDNQIVVYSPAGTAGQSVDVTVTTGVGTSAISAADLFTYVQAPSVTGVSPSAGPAAGGTQVTITGTWLANATAVYFVDSVAGTSTLATIVPGSDTGTQLTVISPKGVAGHTVGIEVVTVSGSGAGWTVTAGDQFTYVAAPTVSSVTVTGSNPPSSVGPATGGTTVTIQGTNLINAVAVYFGATLATIVPGSDTGTQLQVVSPPGAAGTVDVTVVTVGGASAISAADEFTYIAAPTVTGISPAAGPVGTTTTLTTKINDATTTTLHVADASQFPAASGTFPFIIQVDGEQMLVTGGGGGVNATWTVQRGYDNTTPTSHNRNAVVTGGLTTVTIQGTGLANATAVYFGTALATIISDGGNQIVVTSPAGIAGTVDITVTTTGGTSATSAADRFTYSAAPTVTSIGPTSGPATGGTQVTIAGTNLARATAVWFGDRQAIILSNTATQLVVAAPGDETGTVDITVVTAGGTSSVTPADQFTYLPAITGVSPSTGPLTGGTAVTITGVGFTGLTAIYFGNTLVAPSSWTVVSDSQITVTPPAATAPGTVDITVTVIVDGVSETSQIATTDRYTYVAVPSVTGINPSAGPTTGGTTVTITGTGLANAMAVYFGTNLATIVPGNNTDIQLVVASPAGVAGTVDVQVVTAGGQSTPVTADKFTYAAVPSVTHIAPAIGPANGGTTVILYGSGLSNATAVYFGTFQATIVPGSNTDGQITVTTPLQVNGTSAIAAVTVVTAGGTSAVLPADWFTFVAAPAVTGISPAAGPLGGKTTVTITGTGLANATAVQFGSVTITSANFISDTDTQIVVTSPKNPAGNIPSTVDLTVVTFGGTSATSAADQFSYAPVPVVTSISPAAGPATGGSTVTIAGTGLANATAVYFVDAAGNKTLAAIVPGSNSGTQLMVTSPAGVAGTTVDVEVVTAGGPSDITSAPATNYQFTYVAAPTVSGVTVKGSNPPLSSGLVTGGTKVVISGTGLSNVTAVYFDGTLAAIDPDSLGSDTPTSLTVISPAHAAGMVDVTVVTAGGTSAISAADDFTYVGAPVVTGISPAAGPLAGNTTVTITGVSLTNATAVYFGTVKATIIPGSNSDTQIVVTTGAATIAGMVDVTVVTAVGTSAIVAGDQFTYAAIPSVASIAPAKGPAAGGSQVTITGTGLANATAVWFIDTTAGTQTLATIVAGSDTDTQLVVTAPVGVGGDTVDVEVVTAGGSSDITGAPASNYQFTYVAAPSVSSITPATGPAAGGTTVTIYGAYFGSATAVYFGNTLATIVSNSGTQLKVTSPANIQVINKNNVLVGGTVDITVITPGGTSAIVGVDEFTYVAAPVVTGISPAAGPVGGGTTVTITGTGLANATAVMFGTVSVSKTNFISDTDGTLVVPAPQHAAGTVDVTVVTAIGTSAVSAADQFTYAAIPSVTSIAPAKGPAAGGSTVTITGAGLANATAVWFIDTTAGTQTLATIVAGSDTDTQLTVTTPAGVANHTVDVEVVTAGGSSDITSAPATNYQFTYVAAPTVSGVTVKGSNPPLSSGLVAGGTKVVISGTGLSNVTAVYFGGTLATIDPDSLSSDTPTSLTVISPAHAAGMVDVTVVTAGGASAIVAADEFTYIAAPAVTGVSPAAGPLNGGTTVTITGTGLANATAVYFGGIQATIVAGSNTDTQIVVTTGKATVAGTVDVRVVTAVGTSPFAVADQFTYAAVPQVASVSPAVGPAVGGSTITLTGTGLGNATAVWFIDTTAGTQKLATIVAGSNTDTQLAVITPAGVAGHTVDIEVVTAGGQSTPATADHYSYVAAPIINSVTANGKSPAMGPTAGGTIITITGSGFTNVLLVSFYDPATGIGVTATNTIVNNGTNSDSQLTVMSPAHVAGTVDIIVTTAGGSSVFSMADQFTYVAAPAVTGLLPPAGPVGDPVTGAGTATVAILGTGLANATAVMFGNVPATKIVSDSDTELVVVSPAGVAGTVDVTVTTAGGASTISAADQFTYAAIPAVTTIAPAVGPAAGGNQVTITGTGLANASAVWFGGNQATIVTDSATQLVVTAPAGTAGKANVTVLTAGGASAAVPYTYVAAPTISGVTVQNSNPSRSYGPATGGSKVVISGTGLNNVTAVYFGATLATIDPDSLGTDSPTQLTVISPAGTAGTVDITVVNAGGTSAIVAADEFTYVVAPVVTGISPTAGPLAGGTTVTINGMGLANATAIYFGTIQATIVAGSNTDTQIVVTTGKATIAGTVDVTVVTAMGTSAVSAVDQFTYTAIPAVTSIAPAQGPAAGGNTITLTGTGLANATAVWFGTIRATIQSDSATQLVVTSPAGAAGTVNVTVVTAGGTSTAVQYAYVAAPTISSVAVNGVTPATGPAAGGTTVTIKGANLANATAVYFGTTLATIVVTNSNNDSQLTVTSPAGTAGTVDVTVWTVGGTSVISAVDQFTYIAAPAVTGVSPTAGPAGGGTTVTITGTGLANATAVNFGSVTVSAANFISNSAAQIVLLSPPNIAGTVDVTVVTAGGTSATSAADQFTYAPAPVVAALNPAAGPLTGGTTVTITGTGLANALAVKFGGNLATIQSDSPTQLVVTSPVGAAGTVDVTVITAGGTSTTSAADLFTYAVAPTVARVSPAAGPVAGNTTVTITGTNLATAWAVRFGTTLATIVSNTGTQLVVSSPAGVAGTVDITVATAGGTSATSAADQFTYVAVPTVTGISPTVGSAAGGTIVTITGTNLANASAVKFGNTLATIISDANNQLVVASPLNPAGNVASTVDVTVVTLGGTSVTSAADKFTYQPGPAVASLNPSTGPIAGGTAVMITGSGMANATAVYFGKTLATITSVSATQIMVTSPASAVGTVDVTVVTAGGTSAVTSADQFTYVTTPTVSGISPSAGPSAGETTVAINGTNLANAWGVYFGTTLATIVSNTGTQIVVTSPVNSAGNVRSTVDVTVVTTGGTSAATSADLFTYVPTPAVTSVTPSYGPAGGGTTVSIAGTGFANATAVMFGTNAATIISDSDTLLVVSSPAATVAGPVDVTVTTLGGTSAAIAADQFTYAPLPTIMSLTPSSGPVAGGTIVTITGTNLTNGSVKFGNNWATIQSSSATQIVVISPAGVAGTVNVTVTTTGGTSGTSVVGQFTYLGVPTVTGISPAFGPVAGGVTVTITGTNLANATAVMFGTVPATIQSSSANQIVVTNPPGVVGTVDVIVTTGGGTSVVSTADQFTYLAAPTVTGVSPLAGPVAGGTTVTITGTGLANATAVKFGSLTAVIQSSSATQLVVTSPASPVGTVDITVTTAAGTSAVSAADQFTYAPVPVVTAISPPAGSVTGGTTVTITGTGLTYATAVEFGSTPGTSLVVNSDTQITVTSPAGVAGTVNLTVVSVGGTSATSAADQFTYVPATLVVNTAADELDPTYNAADVSLRTALALANIVPGETITFDPKLNGSTLTLSLGELPITDSVTIQGPGSTNLKISAGGQSRIFDVNDDNPATNINVAIDGLTLTGGGNVNFGGAIDSYENLSLSDVNITANTALQGGGGIFVSSAGTTLIQNSSISGNSTSGSGGGLYATTNGGTTTIVGSTISGNTAKMGGGIYAPTWQLGRLTIQNSTLAGNSATLMGGGIWTNASNGGTVAIQNSTLTGNTADAGASGTGKGGGLYAAGGTPSVASTIIAGNLVDKVGTAPDVFGAVAATNSLIGDLTGSTGLTEAPVGTPDTNGNLIGGPTHGVINAKLGPLANNGGSTQTCALLVGSPAIDMGSNPASLSYDQRGPGYPRVLGSRADIGAYEYTATPSAPVVATVSPATGSTAGGTTVTITGSNLAGATAVKFGGVAATIQSSSATQVVVLSPVGAVGGVDVTVTTANGTSAATSADRFTYTAAAQLPTVTGLTPAAGSTAGGTTVAINGTNLTGATAVKFGSFAATIQSISATQIIVITPANAAGTVDVTVTTPNGTSATSSADLFAYTANAGTSTVGLYNPTNSTFLLENTNTSGFAQTVIAFGAANGGYVPLTGDWNGDGTDTIGLYNPTTSMFFLSNSNTGGFADTTFVFGPAKSGDIPLVGDWNGDGKDTIGLYNPATGMFFLKNTNSTGFADTAFLYGPGNAGWTPVVGDWNGDGKDTVALYNPATSMFYERNSNTTGFADTTFVYGPAQSGWKPLVGDWTGSGTDTIGLFSPTASKFYLRNSNSTGFANTAFNYGPANSGYVPLVGDWTGTAEAEMAASQGAGGQSISTLAQADLQPIVNEAITLWSQAGLNAAEVQKLRQAQFVIADLPGSYLGETEGNVIYLDTNAAGNGWFIDPTPAANEEFSAQPGSQQMQAVDPRAVDHIDLLTVVEHELGHVAGLKDVDALADDVMNGVLGTGVRRIASHTDAALASEKDI